MVATWRMVRACCSASWRLRCSARADSAPSSVSKLPAGRRHTSEAVAAVKATPGSGGAKRGAEDIARIVQRQELAVLARRRRLQNEQASAHDVDGLRLACHQGELLAAARTHRGGTLAQCSQGIGLGDRRSRKLDQSEAGIVAGPGG